MRDADPLDRIEQRVADVQGAIASNPYGSPVATGWYAQDVPALVKVARAARAYRDGERGAYAALHAALAELEDEQ